MSMFAADPVWTDFFVRWGAGVLIFLCTTALSFVVGRLWGQYRARREWAEKSLRGRINIGVNSFIDGRLEIRSLTERTLEEVFLNPVALKKVRAAATQTTPDDSLLPLAQDDCWFLLNFVLSAFSERFSAGVIRHDAGLPVQALRYRLFLTCEKAGDARIEALRHPTDGAAPLDFPTANLAGRTTLPQLAALAAAADIGLCLDTGPMHVARAVALPMVILAADTQAGPIEWLPLNHPRMPLAFSAYTPPGTGYPMPGDLPAAEVQQKLDALLTLHPEIKRPTRSAQLWANASGVGAQ